MDCEDASHAHHTRTNTRTYVCVHAHTCRRDAFFTYKTQAQTSWWTKQKYSHHQPPISLTPVKGYIFLYHAAKASHAFSQHSWNQPFPTAALCDAKGNLTMEGFHRTMCDQIRAFILSLLTEKSRWRQSSCASCRLKHYFNSLLASLNSCSFATSNPHLLWCSHSSFPTTLPFILPYTTPINLFLLSSEPTTLLPQISLWWGGDPL